VSGELNSQALQIWKWAAVEAVELGTRKLRSQLNRIEERIKKMAITQAQFDAQITSFLADLDAQVTAIDTAVQAIIDKNSAAGNPLDLTAESAQITAAQTKIDGISAQLPSTPTPK